MKSALLLATLSVPLLSHWCDPALAQTAQGCSDPSLLDPNISHLLDPNISHLLDPSISQVPAIARNFTGRSPATGGVSGYRF
jgi:hypothetical protein